MTSTAPHYSSNFNWKNVYTHLRICLKMLFFYHFSLGYWSTVLCSGCYQTEHSIIIGFQVGRLESGGVKSVVCIDFDSKVDPAPGYWYQLKYCFNFVFVRLFEIQLEYFGNVNVKELDYHQVSPHHQLWFYIASSIYLTSAFCLAS